MTRDIVVIGASAGGVQAVLELVGALPERFDAAVFVVIHTSPDSPGVLPALLSRKGPLPAEYPRDGEKVRTGRIYVAPRDRHMLLEDGVIRVNTGPKENGFRPAVDPLFRTAAACCGARVIGVVLSGGLDDGTQGLIRIKRHGGVSIAQDPNDAIFPSMPLSAIAHDHVDDIVPLVEIPALLVRYTSTPVSQGAIAMAKAKREEPDPAEYGDTALKDKSMPGPPSGLTCPECGGALWELRDGRLTRYRCHVGHQYSPDGLEQAQAEDFEMAMWSALRALEERAELKRRMAARVKELPGPLADNFQKQAEETEKQATIIRNLLLNEPEALRKPTGQLATRQVAELAEPKIKRSNASRAKAKKSSKSKPRRRAAARASDRHSGNGHRT